MRLRESMSAQIRGALRAGKAGRSWEAIAGYGLSKLREHIERQFARGMSWDNYGDWHIDHVLPVSSFTFETVADPEFRAAWALTNLRPLWAPANMSKGARRTHLL